MPMLESLHFEEFYGLRILTLDAPRLRLMTFRQCDTDLELELVHADSVEWLDTDFNRHLEVKKLSNLKYFFERIYSTISTELLPGLGQLKELHLIERSSLWELFEQRQKYGLADLKFYLFSCLVNGPDDPAMDALIYFQVPIDYLAANPSRMADYIPFSDYVRYEEIEHLPSEFAISFLNRSSNLVRMTVYKPVQDIEHFLNVIENHIADLEFAECPEGGQLQELFDRLPEHCDVQKLKIGYVPSNLEFLFRLKHLMSLTIKQYSISVETVRKVLEGLPFLLKFKFTFENKRVTMKVVNLFKTPKLFKLCMNEEEQLVADLNAAIQFVTSLL